MFSILFNFISALSPEVTDHSLKEEAALGLLLDIWLPSTSLDVLLFLGLAGHHHFLPWIKRNLWITTLQVDYPENKLIAIVK